MSFTENDRKVQSKMGKSFPDGRAYDERLFLDVIASTLRAEFGASTSAVKVVARLTQTNERAVRNWFDGKNGPSGENLVRLISHSEGVLKAILKLAGRPEPMLAIELVSLRRRLLGALAAIDDAQRLEGLNGRPNDGPAR